MKGYKVVTAKEMARIEALALKSGCNQEEFMSQAGLRVSEAAQGWIEEHHLAQQVVLLVGKGNKGGDAFAAGLELLNDGFQVRAYHLAPINECQPLCQKFAERFRKKGGLIQDTDDITFGPDELIIDGIFGTGFEGAVEGLYKIAIERANESDLPILAIDIPSGLNGSTGEIGGSVIHAHLTVTMGLPKVGFFLKNGWNFVGELSVGDFGLPPEWIERAEEVAFLPNWKKLKSFIPKTVRNRHKYQAGFVIGFAGSPHFSGAAKLASWASLGSGAGIVKLFYPPEAESSMTDTPYEVIRTPWNEQEWNEALKRASAVFIGPGLGRSEAMKNWLLKYVPSLSCPVVLDADALLPSLDLPSRSICTPHRREAERLLGEKSLDEETLFKRSQAFCDQKKSILVLKGAPTWVFIPESKPFIIAHGDPGMATAGSGDVLTGLIASLLAQGCTERESALLGVMLHALAGEEAAKEKTSHCMMARDLIQSLPKAFRIIQEY